MLLTDGGGAQNVNRSSEMRRQTDTVAQKMLLEQGGGTPGAQCEPFIRNTQPWGTRNANRSAEMHHAWDPKMQTVQQKYAILESTKR